MKLYVKRSECFEDAHNSSLALLAMALEREYHIDINSLKIQKNAYGKPFFENSDIHFSISHSDQYIAVAIGKINLGTDIQKITDISERLMMRFVGKAGIDPTENTRLWTEYESLAKLVGTGIPLKEKDRIECSYKTFCDIDGFVITLCVEKENSDLLSGLSLTVI